MRIMVTGCLGTIGKALTKELNGRGHEVFGCDLAHGEDQYSNHYGGEGHYQKCDVSQYREVDRVLRNRLDLVYHAAAEFGRWNGEDFYERLWRTNVIGTKHVLRLQSMLGFRLVHFSSSEVYGNLTGKLKEPEVATRLLNDYAMTKWVNEQQILNAGGETVVVRLFNTYGPGEYYSPYRSVNCQFLYRAMKGLPLRVYKGHSRTSTYVGDTVRTLANIADNFNPGTTYNIAGDTQHTIEELAQVAMWAMDSTSKIDVIPRHESMTTISKDPDISLAKQDLDHKCEVKLRDGMKLTADWMRHEYNK